jgi:hypothetical protein
MDIQGTVTEARGAAARERASPRMVEPDAADFVTQKGVYGMPAEMS